MPKISLTEDELTNLLEALNAGVEPPPTLQASSSLPSWRN
jgi:hypothetical protein